MKEPETMTAAARPSVRMGVLAATVVSAVTLAISIFELSAMDVFPSALLLLGILPLTALVFFACLLWSASQLLRIRKDGVKFALPFAICVAALLVLGWLACGPFMKYSELWQLAINTSTTILTFLMVFLIQRSQNKEAKAVQLKLNEIVASLEGASNRMIAIEDLGEKELDDLAPGIEGEDGVAVAQAFELGWWRQVGRLGGRQSEVDRP